jgi:DNA processing protein
LVAEFGADALLARLASADADGRRSARWQQRVEAVQPERVIEQANDVGARFICPGDDEWPIHLVDLDRLATADGERRAAAPFGLWVRGDRSLAELTSTAVAVVGARASTAYGDHVAGELAASCGVRGFTTVSGGAYGIDAAAHRGALASAAPTVAVLAGGIDRLYPPGNQPLLRSVVREGLVVSEAAPGCTPSRSRFLVRNRLIAALGNGTVVVEAALRSGALSTARWARDIGRPVMGTPGPVTSMTSAGVHELLRQPECVLVTDAAEVVEQLSAIGSGLAPRKVGEVLARDRLDLVARQVLDAVPKHVRAPTASIAVVAGLTAEETADGLRTLTDARLVDGDVEQGWRLTVP